MPLVVAHSKFSELYLWPFADAVRAGVGSIMCSYNQVNNSYACQNSEVLNHLLKTELNFQGFVMSDWSAQHTGVASALAGLDMSMVSENLSFRILLILLAWRYILQQRRKFLGFKFDSRCDQWYDTTMATRRYGHANHVSVFQGWLNSR